MKKKGFIGLLSALCAICLTFGVTVCVEGVAASAEAVPVTGTATLVDGEVELESFTMLSGASVKKTGERQGMRFTTQISEDDLAKLPNNAQFGTLVLPKHMLSAGQLTKQTASVLDIQAGVWKEDSKSGMKEFTGVLVDYTEEFYATEMLARSYVTYTDKDGKEHTVYAKNVQTRDLAYVVSAALNAGETGGLLTDVMASVAPAFAFASSSVSISLGEAYELELAKGQGEGLDVSYQSDNEDVALVDDSGIVWGRSVGTAKITATMNGKTATVSVTVKGESATEEALPEWTDLSIDSNIGKDKSWTVTPTADQLSAIGAVSGASYRGLQANEGVFGYECINIFPTNTDSAYWEAYADYTLKFDWYYVFSTDRNFTSTANVDSKVEVFGAESAVYANSTWHTASIKISELLNVWSEAIAAPTSATKTANWLRFRWTTTEISDKHPGTVYFGNIRIEEPAEELPVWSTMGSGVALNGVNTAVVSNRNHWSAEHIVRNGLASSSEVAQIGGTGAYEKITWGSNATSKFRLLPINEESYYTELNAKGTYNVVFDWYYDLVGDPNNIPCTVYVYGSIADSNAQNTLHTESIPLASLLSEGWSKLTDTSYSSFVGTPWLNFDWTSAFANSGYSSVTMYIGNVRIESASGGGESTLPENVDATVWTADGTEKFLQNQIYSNRYTNTTLTYNVFKNETESAQIMITPAQNIAWYGVMLSSLTNKNGEVLSLKNFEVFHQKYVKITEVKNTEITTVVNGMYPDALIPISVAAKYGETAIVAGNNQGVWITVNVPADQEAGVYTGEFIVLLDGVAFPVEVSVNVYDYAVSDEVYSESRFSLGWDNVEYAEGIYGGSASVEVQRAYYEYMLDMGISIGSLPGVSDFYFHYNGTYDPNADVFADDFAFTYGGADYDSDGINEYYKNVDNGKMETYVQEVANYTLDDRCTMIPLAVRTYEGVYYELDTNDSDSDGNTTEYVPVTKYTVKYTYDGTEYAVSSVDQVQLLRTVKELYKYSLANGVNMFEKLSLVLSWIDEFSGNLTEMASAEYNLKLLSDWFDRCKTYLVAHESEYPLGKGVSASFRTQVLNSLTGIKVITPTANPTANMTTEDTPFVLCPTIDAYHLQSNRNEIKAWVEACYGEGASLWTYTCVNPAYPNPTYHLGDNLISSRLLSWMMYEYGITGNLYWSTMYVKNGVVGSTEYITDMYGNPLRSGEVNGDGYLLYPGSAYGVVGPIGSIRLQSIRDGIEEYNLLYSLEGYAKARAAAKGETYSVDNFRSVLHMLTEALYSGTQVKYEDGYLNNFANSREMLAELLVLAKNGIVVENSVTSGDTVTVTISAPEGVEFGVNGSVASQTANGFVTYTVTLSVAEDGSLNITTGSGEVEEEEETLPAMLWNDMSQASALTTTINPWTAAQATRNGLVSASKVAELGGVSGAAYTSVTAMSNWFCYAGYQIVPSNTDKAVWEAYSEYNIVFDWYYDITGDTSNTYHYQVSVYGAENAVFAQDTWHTSRVPMSDILADWSDVIKADNNGGDNSSWKPWIKFKWTSGSHASQAGTVYIGNIRIEKPALEEPSDENTMPNVNLSIPLTAETTMDSSWLSSATAKYQKRAWSSNLSSGSVSTKTLSASNSVGGKTSGSYYYFEATTSPLGNIRAFSLQPNSSSVLENAGDTELQFDVYFEIQGSHSSEMKNCFLTGQMGNRGVQEGVWHTFSVKLSTILEYWSTYSKPAGSGSPYEIALFAINLEYGSNTNDVNCYIGNFKLVEP